MPASFYWITKDVPGRLGIAPRPRGNDWLQDDMQTLRKAGVDVLVSLLTSAEEYELSLQSGAATCKACGMEYMAFPIDDRQTPANEVASLAFAQRVVERLTLQKNVIVHCRMGIGRAAMMAAAVLVLRGMSVEAAFAQITSARGCSVPDTPEQRAWVERFSARVGNRAMS